MDRKQKEALGLALAEKGKTYREITREARVSPITIKAVLSKAGLDQNTSLASRAFELFSEGKNPLQVAIALNLNAEKAIQYHQEYFMLLGCTEFTKVYPLIKDNPCPFVNLVKLVLASGMGDGEVVELLKIAKGYLPSVRLEYDVVKAELNSIRAELNNTVQIYQQFVDSNIALKKREVELRQTIDELEAKKSELQKPKLNEPLPEIHENNGNKNVSLKVQQEDVVSNDVLIPQPNMSINYNQYENENETSHYPPQVEPLSSPLL